MGRGVRLHLLAYPPDSDTEATIYDLTADLEISAPARQAAISSDCSRVAVAFADHDVLVWSDVPTAGVTTPTTQSADFPVLCLCFGTVSEALHLLLAQGTRTDVRRIESDEEYGLV